MATLLVSPFNLARQLRLGLIIFAFCSLSAVVHAGAHAIPEVADAFVDIKAAPGGDGLSWSTAFDTLQAALEAATDRDVDGDVEIWIAKGTYTPSKTYTTSGGEVGGAYGETARATGGAYEAAYESAVANGLLFTFNLSEVAGALTGKSIALFGGFKGTKRDPRKYKTILSGNLQDDAETTNNAWHVLMLSDDVSQRGIAAVLSGLIVEEGNADGPFGNAFDHDEGGGIYSNLNAGAVQVTELVLADMVLRNNVANFAGGGIRCRDEGGAGSMAVSNSRFTNNATGFLGGGIAFLGESFDISNSRFSENSTLPEANGGGAVHADVSMNAVIEGNRFENNFAGAGGAIRLFGSGTANVLDNRFLGNAAAVLGGALDVWADQGDTYVEGNAFENNFAGAAGGGAILHSPAQGLRTFDGNVFSENRADGVGGAIWFNTHGQLSNNIFDGNSAGTAGGGVATSLSTTLELFGGDVFEDNYAEAIESEAFLALIQRSGFSEFQLSVGGGALAVLAGSNAIVANTKFEDNFTTGGDGGAISVGGSLLNFAPGVTFTNGGMLSVEDSVFEGNHSAENGGAISAQQLPDSPLIIVDNPVAVSIFNSRFEDNSADGDGGGLFARDVDSLDLEASKIEGNVAGNDGGGIYLENLFGSVTDNTFEDNSAGGLGQHIFSNPADPGDILFSGNLIED